MTPMLLFIDLHEKVVLGMNRRAALVKVKYIHGLLSVVYVLTVRQFVKKENGLCLFHGLVVRI
jgi:hypothetical protein